MCQEPTDLMVGETSPLRSSRPEKAKQKRKLVTWRDFVNVPKNGVSGRLNRAVVSLSWIEQVQISLRACLLREPSSDR